MSTLQEHLADDLRLFGKSYPKIHAWLDEFMGKPGIGMKHRRLRHHRAGVVEAHRLFGPEAALAAFHHIKADLKQEGWTEEKAFPKDEADYVRMCLF